MAHSPEDTALDSHPRRRSHELRAAAAAAAAAAEGHQRGVPAAHPAGERVPVHVPRQEMCGQWSRTASLPSTSPAGGLGLGTGKEARVARGRSPAASQASRGRRPRPARWVRAGAAGRRLRSCPRTRGCHRRGPAGSNFTLRAPEPPELRDPLFCPGVPFLTMPEVWGLEPLADSSREWTECRFLGALGSEQGQEAAPQCTQAGFISTAASPRPGF